MKKILHGFLERDIIMIRFTRFFFLVLFGCVLILSHPACKSRTPDDASEAKKTTPKKKKSYPKEEIYLPGELSPSNFSSPPGAITFAFAGDIMMWDRMQKPIEKHGVNYPFEATAALLQSADYTVGNLECPIAEKHEKRRKKGFYYKVPSFTLEGLKWAGFDMLSLANNHIRDCGDGGLIETFDFLDEAGLPYFGAGRNLAEAMEPKIVDIKGLKVAFVGFISQEIYLKDKSWLDIPGKYEKQKKKIVRHLAATNERPGTIIAKEDIVREMVSKARTQADLIIVVPHWGLRYHQPIWEDQEILGHAAIDAGADLIVGHHNHIRQAVEVYKGKPIIYGIGNFAFGSRNYNAVGGFLVRVVVTDGKINKVELYPTYTNNSAKQVNFQTKILKGKSAKTALEKMQKLSAKRAANIKIENGVGVIDF